MASPVIHWPMSVLVYRFLDSIDTIIHIHVVLLIVALLPITAWLFFLVVAIPTIQVSRQMPKTLLIAAVLLTLTTVLDVVALFFVAHAMD